MGPPDSALESTSGFRHPPRLDLRSSRIFRCHIPRAPAATSLSLAAPHPESEPQSVEVVDSRPPPLSAHAFPESLRDPTHCECALLTSQCLPPGSSAPPRSVSRRPPTLLQAARLDPLQSAPLSLFRYRVRSPAHIASRARTFRTADSLDPPGA